MRVTLAGHNTARMLSGVKFIPPDQLHEAEQNSDSDYSAKEMNKSISRKEKDRGKKKKDQYDSSGDEEIVKIKKGSKRRKKWYSSDASSSSSLSQTDNESDADSGGEAYQKHKSSAREKNRKKEKRTQHQTSNDEVRERSKKKSKSRKECYSSDDSSDFDSESDDDHRSSRKEEQQKRGRKHKKEKSKERRGEKVADKNDLSDDGRDLVPQENKGRARKEMGLEWMLKPATQPSMASMQIDDPLEEPQVDEKETETTAGEQETKAKTVYHGTEGTISRYAGRNISSRQKKGDDDADMHLARTIVQNKQYSMSGRADDEYDFDGAPSKKRNRKREVTPEKNTIAKRLMTQQERCQFCFENPTRPKHLVVSIANFTYLMLPQWQPVVQGHCCILPMQHESATRTVDNDVWDEIRNFKKCLLMMFAKQDKDVVFLETVMGLAKQRRHCLVECIPLPRDIAKEAPLYFKKAIDEAEDEWSQHNAKKLIDTSQKGLRASIPKDFPYFHVEFGLNKGFVHVIDDETQFKSNLGLNVIRGMLQLPEEDMYRRRKHESVETQKQAVASFVREWDPFDWTKQLD